MLKNKGTNFNSSSKIIKLGQYRKKGKNATDRRHFVQMNVNRNSFSQIVRLDNNRRQK